MEEYKILSSDALNPGEAAIVIVDDREIGVFNIGGEYHGFLNWCPHQGGPVSAGELSGTTSASFDKESLTTSHEWIKEGEIIACPWHGWEFDVKSGDCLSRKDVKVPTYEIEERDGDLYLSL